MAILPATETRYNHYLLALETLGKATEIEMILIAKVSNEGYIASLYHGHFHVQTSPMSHYRKYDARFQAIEERI
jgi:hypothetical protein